MPVNFLARARTVVADPLPPVDPPPPENPLPPADSSSFIGDTLLHAPPMTGPYAYSPPYGNFLPGQPGFPALGEAYTDPVFQRPLRRLTAHSLSGPSGLDIYSKNGWWNADGSRFVSSFPDGTVRGIDRLTGSTVTLTNAGSGARQDASCSPTDPDAFYFRSGSQLKKQLFSTRAVTTLKDFGATLIGLGGTNDWIDNSGRYMLFGTSAGYGVWDSVNDVVFSGRATDPVNTGFIGIAPDASCLILSWSGLKIAYPINKVAQTVGAGITIYNTGTQDHSDYLTASDGYTYAVRCNNAGNPMLMQRIRVPDGQITTFFTFPNETRTYYAANAQHLCGVSRGPNKDWIFCSSDVRSGPEYTQDNFNGTDPVAYWGKMQNEIYAFNILTGEVRRYNHTRSRDVNVHYNHYPRICVDWDGINYAFASNHGHDSRTLGTAGYADIWTGRTAA